MICAAIMSTLLMITTVCRRALLIAAEETIEKSQSQYSQAAASGWNCSQAPCFTLVQMEIHNNSQNKKQVYNVWQDM